MPSSSTIPVNINAPCGGVRVKRALASAPVPTTARSSTSKRTASAMVVTPRSATAEVPAPSIIGAT